MMPLILQNAGERGKGRRGRLPANALVKLLGYVT